MTASTPLPFGSASDLGFCPQRTRNLVQVLQREVDSKRLPGAVALIARRGQVLLHETVGWSMILVTMAVILCVAGAKHFAK